MKVVIVAKTRMGSGACIGGLTFDGRSVRLIAPDADHNDQFNQEYQIGDVWDIEYSPDPKSQPPHTENISVQSKRQLPAIDDVAGFIHNHMPPQTGGPEMLYEGLVQATRAGVQYIAARTGIPPYSTMFWQPDKPLIRDDDAKRIRYRYPTADGGRSVTFVGYQEPLEEIPAGSLLRISLAHWWRPQEMPEGELRCYVQLSGWYQTKPADTWASPDWPPLDEYAYGDSHPENMLTQVLAPIITPPAPFVPPALSEIKTRLKQVFGYDEFRPLQTEVIDNVLNKRDALAVMPTGSGKSLCFQLPALFFHGLTVVVSPLISLMEDQVMQLQEVGVTAVYLNSTLSYEQHLYTSNQIRAGQVKLLYVAPETLLRPETLLLLQQSNVDCLTIDEAHCISAWGHDFRPEYRQLADVRRRLPDAVCIAVTATATERVRADIKTTLEIPDAGEFLASFNRENLFLAAEPKTDGLAQTAAFLKNHKNESGIIYCATRKQVDTLTAQLTQRGWPVLPYHAGLSDNERRANQRRFIYEEGLIMVATIAFGMGINKSNVRFILHYDLPKNLESYYQQIGRAGRDGLRADCLLLSSYADVGTINYFINQQAPDQQRGARARLEAMLGFVEATMCRRRPLLTYFGENYTIETCDMCDNCQSSDEEYVDLTIPAQKYLSCVKRTGEIFGMTYIIDVLRGSRSQKILTRNHDRLSTYNIGGEFSKKEWQFLARQFIQQGLLIQDMQHGSLKLTPKAYDVFKGEQVLGAMPQRQPLSQTWQATTAHDAELFTRLRDKRSQLANEAGVPPYVIFSDRSLVAMASAFPQTRAAFGMLYGVGQAKLDKYADIFLPLIQAYCQEKGIQEQMVTAVASPPRPTSRSKNRSEEVCDAFNAGQSIADLTAVYNVKQSTIISHLWKAVLNGATLREANLLQESQLPPDQQQQVLNIFAAFGTDTLRPVYEELNQAVSYEELHLLRLHFVCNKL